MMDFLFIVDESFLRFKPLCEGAGLRVQFCSDFDEALATLGRQSFDCLFVDLAIEHLKPLQILDWLATFVLPMRLGVLVPQGREEEIFKVGRLGVTEFIVSNQLQNEALFIDHLTVLVHKQAALKQMSEVEFVDRDGVARVLVVADPFVRAMLEKVKLSATLKLPLLITGAAGTGKSLWLKYYLAQQNQVEDGLVLENIEQMSVEDQNKLRYAFMQKPAQPVVATAVSELPNLVAQGQFSKDVYSLLRQNRIELPPLSERDTDVIFFMQRFARVFEAGKNRFFSKDFCEACLNYDWPGNITELKSVLEAVLKETPEQVITARHLPQKIVARSFYRNREVIDVSADLNYNEAKKRMLNKFNHDYIADLLNRSDQNLTVAAEKAGMDRSNFKKIMKKYDL